MAKEAVVIGGSGLLGRPIVTRLLAAGWSVSVLTRGKRSLPAGVSAEVAWTKVDRRDPGALEGITADLLVDVIPYRRDDADQLCRLAGSVGHVIALSSSAVYASESGRSLLADPEADRPVPIPERHRTVLPGDDSYEGRKAAIEKALLEAGDLPSTIVRPGAVYGPHDTGSREWHFVRRVIDRRDKIVLAYGGASRFHQVAADNVGELVACAARRPGDRVLNAADETARSVSEIARAVAQAMDHRWREVTFEGAPGPDGVGDTPWALPKPLELDMDEARRQLGYAHVIGYDEAIMATCRWLEQAVAGRDWRKHLPRAAERYGEMFDYAAEDAFVRGLAASSG